MVNKILSVFIIVVVSVTMISVMGSISQSSFTDSYEFGDVGVDVSYIVDNELYDQWDITVNDVLLVENGILLNDTDYTYTETDTTITLTNNTGNGTITVDLTDGTATFTAGTVWVATTPASFTYDDDIVPYRTLILTIAAIIVITSTIYYIKQK